MPAGILTSTSLPFGSATRFFTPLAASGSVMVSEAVISLAGAGEIVAFELEAAARGARRAPRPPNISFRTSSKLPNPPRPPPGEPPRPPEKPSGPQVKVSKPPSRPAPPPGPRPRAEAFEALEARLALGVDLAAVEGLALVVLAQDFVGGVELGEARGGVLVVLVGVGVQLLGELAEGALDVRGARALGHP